jgi:hypothetical protein
MDMAGQQPTPKRRLIFLIRYVLPALICLAGVLLFALNPSLDTADGAAAIIGAGLSVYLLNFLYRMGVSGDRDRDDEAEARRYFDEHGHWPDEADRKRRA